MGKFVKVYKAEPIYVLTSKVIKSKEKNRLLIKQGLEIYGEELSRLIIKFGGDPNEFNRS